MVQRMMKRTLPMRDISRKGNIMISIKSEIRSVSDLCCLNWESMSDCGESGFGLFPGLANQEKFREMRDFKKLP